MFHTSGGVSDLRMPEIGFYLVGVPLGTPQVTPHVSHHLRLVACTPLFNRVGLDVVIE